MIHVIEFPAPAGLLNLNDRLHWAARSRAAREWRTAAFYGAKRAGVSGLGYSSVSVELPVRDRRTRDPHNFVSTVKPLVDGLVDAGVWPDDSSEWVTVAEPVLVVGGQLVRVTIEEVEQ